MGHAMNYRLSALGAAGLLFFVLPAGKAAQKALPSPIPHRLRASELFAPSVRRSAQAYLRLKLLELREADLERVRLVIERKLDVDALFGTPPPETKVPVPRNKS